MHDQRALAPPLVPHLGVGTILSPQFCDASQFPRLVTVSPFCPVPTSSCPLGVSSQLV